MPYQPTTDDLRAAWSRCKVLHLYGWTFERAMAVRVMRITLTASARAHHAKLEAQHGRALPTQAALI